MTRCIECNGRLLLLLLHSEIYHISVRVHVTVYNATSLHQHESFSVICSDNISSISSIVINILHYT